MRAVVVRDQNASDPRSGAAVVDLAPPSAPSGWVRVRVQAASLNHHDVWSLRGVGLPADRLPMVLGTDATGLLDDDSPVIVHGVVSADDWHGDETLDPRRTLLSEKHPGTLAQEVWVPARNTLPRHPDLSVEHAACLPTAYLTAYRLLFTAADLRPGQTVLVQGSGGGVATASILLARAAGLRVWVTAREPERGAAAVALGAHASFAAGERLPEQVDAVVETVGEATWAHSLRSLRPGGVVAVAGATTGASADADLNRMFFRGLRVVGSTMGTWGELERVQRLLVTTGVRPLVDRVVGLEDVPDALGDLAEGRVRGKIVVRVA
ncbi:zinc-binding dehydrogenase [Serinibacter arcticus]|uniref:Cinnamyl alcohol dehydrogenase/reductase n=1 Tax=Serinibacter arcticus TaxID=1655435 RepID=A0A4Z1DYN2_9MICO|nr:zinc-binding dehydrogenase [Serinibacter arcticus]TGO04039.1 Cinnamyl alcohol dehydrogenase/reductase [Serinibacter arcticus]